MSKERRYYTQWLDPTGREAIKRASRCLDFGVSDNQERRRRGKARERLKSSLGAIVQRSQHGIDSEIASLRLQIQSIKNGTEDSPYVSCAELSDKLWKLRRKRRGAKVTG